MPSFYHVDLFGELNVGDTLDLYWPPQVHPNRFALPTDDSINPDHDLTILKDEFPEGLSSHGARHALSALVKEDDFELPGKFQGMVGLLFIGESQDGDFEEIHFPPSPILFETGIELVRRAEFESKQSRFQTYFGCHTVGEADQYREKYRNGNGTIVEVECNSFDVRDMDLVDENDFFGILQDGRKYWCGEAGSDDPTWEIAMEPPVEVVDVV